MLSMKQTLGTHPAGGLWWAALLIAVIGGSITYVLSLDRLNPGTRHDWTLSLMITILAVGVCIISATSGWWMKR